MENYNHELGDHLE